MIKAMMRAAAGILVAALLGTSAHAQEPVIGLAASVTSVDPHFHNLTPNVSVSSHIFDRLIHQDEKQHLVPGLATEWKAIDDTTWEFKLRQDVKFHDGSDFDAEDVVASLKRVPWVPNSPSSFAAYTRSIVETQIIDPYTIRFKTAQPVPLLPIDLSTIFIVSSKFETAPTGDFNSGRAAIGTGPFKLVEYVNGDRIVLARNDAYWGPKAPWPRVTLKTITNNAARVAALLAGDVQMIEAVPAVDLPRLRTTPDISLAQVTGFRVIYLHLDSFRDQTPFATDKAGPLLPNNPLKDKRVRQALSKAINRPAIVERLMEGTAIAAGGLLPEGFFGVSPKLKPDAFDPDEARRLLAEAGYPNGFALGIHGPNDRYPNDEKVLQAIGPMLSRVGIDTRVHTQPWATFAQQASNPNYAYSVMLVGWGSDTGEVSSPLRALLSTVNAEKGLGASNRGRYSNPKVDGILAHALATVDDAKRDKMLQEASEIAIGEYGIVPLYYQINYWATRKGFSYTARVDERTLAQFLKPAN
jgi:peptide/nickel transport system substrate-binding protein